MLMPFVGLNAQKQTIKTDSTIIGISLQEAYDNAWNNYQIGYYKKALEQIKPFYDRGDAPSDVYQLLGNIYDAMGMHNKANTIYDEGLLRFPKAGNLFLEKGNVQFADGKYPQALYWYEKGIENDPTFASNYYCASKVFFLSTEKVWGVMYGELFMLLEQESDRCKAFSKQLYDVYAECFQISGGKAIADFDNKIIVYSDSFERPNRFPEVFDSLMSKVAANKRYISIENLIQIRKQFVSRLSLSNSDMNNVLFNYWQKLISMGYFEAYNYWLFAYGNNAEATRWINNNKQKWNSFRAWFQKNPISLSEKNYFSRYLME